MITDEGHRATLEAMKRTLIEEITGQLGVPESSVKTFVSPSHGTISLTVRGLREVQMNKQSNPSEGLRASVRIGDALEHVTLTPEQAERLLSPKLTSYSVAAQETVQPQQVGRLSNMVVHHMGIGVDTTAPAPSEACLTPEPAFKGGVTMESVRAEPRKIEGATHNTTFVERHDFTDKFSKEEMRDFNRKQVENYQKSTMETLNPHPEISITADEYVLLVHARLEAIAAQLVGIDLQRAIREIETLAAARVFAKVNDTNVSVKTHGVQVNFYELLQLLQLAEPFVRRWQEIKRHRDWMIEFKGMGEYIHSIADRGMMDLSLHYARLIADKCGLTKEMLDQFEQEVKRK